MTEREAPSPDKPPLVGPPATLSFKADSLISAIALTAVTCEIVLVLFDLFLNYARPYGSGAMRRLFNITREDGLASWFATTQTLLIALTLWLLWALVRREGGPRLRRHGWLAVAAFFSYMAIDDGAMIHERVGTALGGSLRSAPGTDASWVSRGIDLFPSYNWQLFLMPLFAAAGLLLLLFLWRELAERRLRMLLLAALACLAIAVGLDFVEGLDLEHPWNLHVRLNRIVGFDAPADAWFGKTGVDAIEHFSKSIEEFLEMLANTLMWVVFLRYLTERYEMIRIRFE
jgi:hypothetical protein